MPTFVRQMVYLIGSL